jgi:hypothetical protein
MSRPELRADLISLLVEIRAGSVYGEPATRSKYLSCSSGDLKVTPQVEELMAHELACRGEVIGGTYPVLLTPAGELLLDTYRSAS